MVRNVVIFSDAELLVAHARGDPQAFAELFRRHRDRLWSVALRTAGDREEAADALQDAMVSAFRGARSFRAESRVSTWLHRIVVNACRDRARRRRCRPVPADRTAESAAPERPATEPDTRAAVRAALAELPDEQRAAIVLVDVQGWSVADSAAVLGVAPGTVKSRCARGRTRLARRLGHLRTSEENADVPAAAAVRRQEGR